MEKNAIVGLSCLFPEAETPGQLENSAAPPSIAPTKMAIIGMDAFFGSCHDLDAFGRSVYAGKQHFIPLPPDRWMGIDDRRQLLRDYGFDDGEPPWGAYIQDFQVGLLHLRLPPSDADRPIPQQLLTLRVADNALQDAGLDEGENVAVIVAMGTELALHQFRGRDDLSWQIKETLARQNIALQPSQTSELETTVKDSLHERVQVTHYTSSLGNVTACRISSAWGFSGPAFALSAEENSVFKALAAARMLLAAGEVDAVVVGAVDLAGGAENVLLRNQWSPVNTGARTMSYDRNANGWLVGEGAGAVVLRRLDAAKQNDDRIYAVIDAVSFVQEDPAAQQMASFLQPSSAQTVGRACQRALDSAGLEPDDIGYLEVFASGIGQQDKAEISGLIETYRPENGELAGTPSCAIGSVKSNVGHTFAASGMASLIKTALCLYQRYIPATPGWSGPKAQTGLQDSPFYVATESRPWFVKAGALKRVAAINGLGLDQTCAHVILSEDSDRTERGNKYPALARRAEGSFLFLVAGDDCDQLLEKLAGLQQTIEDSDSLGASATQGLIDFQNRPAAAFAVAIVGHDKEKLLEEIQRAFRGVPYAFEQGREWQSPLGSYFAAQPLGRRGTVAFVYPGAFNAYVGLGRDVLYLFPQLYDRIAHMTSNAGRSFAEEFLYPRSLDKLSPAELDACAARLMDNPTAMVESGASFAALFTMIMQDCFQVRPQSAFGYSLGEASMMWALGVWTSGDQGSDAWHASSLFKTRLSGPKDTVRELWKLDQGSQGFWSTYILAAPAARVVECLENEARVYLTIINTPREVVIAGNTPDCERVIETLKCAHLRAPFDSVMHCDAMRSEYDELVKLYTLPVNNVPGIDFYSADKYEPTRLDSESLGHTVARVSCSQVDFPRLVDRVYGGGARIFIELGPQGTCSRWIGKILDGKEHFAMTINQDGRNDYDSIVRVLAKLASHRVPVDFSPLHSQMQTGSTIRSLVKTITLGGKRIGPTILTQENRLKFAGATSPPRHPKPVHREPEIPRAKSVTRPPVTDQPITHESHKAVYQESVPALASYHKLKEHMARVSQSHAAFLQARSAALRQAGELVQLQITAAQQLLDHSSQAPAEVISHVKSVSLPIRSPTRPSPSASLRGLESPPALFNEYHISEFATGSVANCFGPQYAYLENRRAPHTPNGDLQLISRIMEVNGKLSDLQELPSLVSEYDVPTDSWFYRQNAYPTLPYSILMEMALQPCGFLSGWLGSILLFPDEDFHFRNLDGQGRILKDMDVRGKTVVDRVRLLSSNAIQGTIIQRFGFELACEGDPFYQGETVCGYFTPLALANQTGLDGGREVAPWYQQGQRSSVDMRTVAGWQRATPDKPHYRLAHGQLDLLDEFLIVERGGQYGQGYVHAKKRIDPQDWFFSCHFYQDPVMPGSLGVEAILQAMQIYALEQDLGRHLASPRFEQALDHQTIWKYRGQVVPGDEYVQLEIHISNIAIEDEQVTIVGDASFWRDGLRIYEVKQVAIRLLESTR